MFSVTLVGRHFSQQFDTRCWFSTACYRLGLCIPTHTFYKTIMTGAHFGMQLHLWNISVKVESQRHTSATK